MKRLVLTLTVVASLGLSSLAGAAPRNPAYWKWLATLNTFSTELGQAFGDLSKGSQVQDNLAIYNSLTRIGNDGRWLAKRAVSPDAMTNQDIKKWAQGLIAVEVTGKRALSGKGSVRKFSLAEAALGKLGQQVSLDIALDNDRYR